MNTSQRAILSLGLLAGAAAAAVPPWLEMQIQVPQEQWRELYAAPSATAWGYAPVWSPPPARYEDDFGYTHRVTYQVDLARLAAQLIGLAFLTAGLCLLAGLWGRVKPGSGRPLQPLAGTGL